MKMPDNYVTKNQEGTILIIIIMVMVVLTFLGIFIIITASTDMQSVARTKIEEVAFYALDAWQVEVYHRGLKQFTGVERAQYRLEVSQRNHIGLAIRAFVRLEAHRLHLGISWFEAKTSIIRSAICQYLAHPTITLHSTA